MKIRILGNELTNTVISFTTSGSLDSPFRTANIVFLKHNIPMDKRKYLANGMAISVEDGDSLLFSGTIYSISFPNSDDDTITIVAYDAGYYLVKNNFNKVYLDKTPSEILKDICSEFSASRLARFGWKHNYDLLSEPLETMYPDDAGLTISAIYKDKSAYDIITAVYSQLTKRTGMAYSIYCDGSYVIILPIQADTCSLEEYNNIRSSNYSESIMDLVNNIVIEKEETSDDALGAVEDDYDSESINMYGLFQVIKPFDKSADEKDGEEIKALGMENHIIKRPKPVVSASAVLNGNSVLKSGGFTILEFEVPNGNTVSLVYKAFVIMRDTHSFTNNDYYTSVDLAYIEIDEIEKAKNKGDIAKIIKTKKPTIEPFVISADIQQKFDNAMEAFENFNKEHYNTNTHWMRKVLQNQSSSDFTVRQLFDKKVKYE